jgi:hypoxanthine phosphoribosyltransferase
MNTVIFQNKEFVPYIENNQIGQRIEVLAQQINEEYKGEKIYFIIVLNGAFMFASDLLKSINLPCETLFIRVQSYEGLTSSGEVKSVLGLTSSIENKNIIIIEDIVDTGTTVDYLYTYLQKDLPKSIKVCTLLYKKDAHRGKIMPDYVAFEIENKFVIGYGLDFEGEARNLNAIYQIK